MKPKPQIRRPLTRWPFVPKRKRTQPHKRPLTVCIAAICGGTIFGASDRMMTSGDVEFEPELDSILKPEIPGPLFNLNTKIIPLTTSVAVMTAGDSGLQSELVTLLARWVKSQLEVDINKWLSVSETAEAYLDIYDKVKLQHAKHSIFPKYGLSGAAFATQQKQLSESLITRVIAEMEEFDGTFSAKYGIETIITGVDNDSGFPAPHIYSITKSAGNDLKACCDSLGFAAIGSGARHAESQFMLAGHSRHSYSPETLLLTYLAKKRSEVAPGVGKGTNMFTIGPALGGFTMLENISDFQMEKIDSIFQALEKDQQNAFKRAKNKTANYIEEMFRKRAEAQPKQPSTAQDAANLGAESAN